MAQVQSFSNSKGYFLAADSHGNAISTRKSQLNTLNWIVEKKNNKVTLKNTQTNSYLKISTYSIILSKEIDEKCIFQFGKYKKTKKK